MSTQWIKYAVVAIATSALAVAQQRPRMALPGTVNYFEGQVSVNGVPLNQNQLGNVDLAAGGVLDTNIGKAEILLSPGVILRAGNYSAVRMVAPDLADPRIEVVRGEALVEVDQKLKDLRIDIMQGNADTSLLKEGLYRFDGNQGTVQVIDGKARVTRNGGSKEIGKEKEIMLGAASVKTVSFDRLAAEDDLYRWSSVRSDYLAQANYSTASVAYAGGPYWGSGWYWNPYFTSWAWLPGDGYFWGPFGYPFFSPAYVVYAPYYRNYRNYGGGGYRAQPGLRAGALPHSSAFMGGGFHGGAVGGGFHGGGGGGRR